jgi:hypothetical protein
VIQSGPPAENKLGIKGVIRREGDRDILARRLARAGDYIKMQSTKLVVRDEVMRQLDESSGHRPWRESKRLAVLLLPGEHAPRWSTLGSTLGCPGCWLLGAHRLSKVERHRGLEWAMKAR